MNLLQMANFICGKVNQTEPEDVTACKEFLTQRHEMTWNEELWKDALVEYRQTLDPDVADYTPASNYLPTKGVLLLPPIILRVIAARTSERQLNIQRPEYFYRIDYDAFAQTGAAAEYILLPPCVWEFNTAQPILTKSTEGDTTSVLNFDLLDSDGVGVTRTAVTLDSNYKLIGTSERIDAISGLARNGSVTIGAPGACTLRNEATIGLTNFDFYFTPTAPVDLVGYTPSATLDSGEEAVLTPDNYLTYTPENDPGILATTAVPGGELFGGTITLPDGDFIFARADPSGVTLATTETNAKRRQRIRLVEIPTTSTVLRVLGKRVCPAFSADNDEPAINGMDNLLIAFGTADMLERDESYSEADRKIKEAMMLLAQLKKIETAQQAHHARIIPEGGFGDDYFTGRTRGFHF